MTSYARPMCFSCVHFDDERPGMYCAAFPDGIPEGITQSQVDHRYSLDGEPIFEQRPDRPEPDWEMLEMSMSPVTAGAADLRIRVQGPVTATATSAWKPDKRKEMAVKGFALPDGSYPIKDKTDWAKAKQALGRAKNRAAVIAHLKKRGKALGIPAEEYEGLTAAAWDPLRHPRGHNGQFIEVGGWVKGLFRLANGQKGERRGQVISISPNRSDPNNPTIHITTTDGENATALANTIDGSVPSKAALDKPGDKQLSLADAPAVDGTAEKSLEMPGVVGEPAPLRPFDGEPLNQWGESEAQYRTRRASEIGVAVDENGVPLNDADTKRLADHLAKGASAPMDESRRYKDDEVDRGEDASAWRDDILKVQNALEQGGWITSVPDDSAPGGEFVYIDPEAPEDLKRLYQKLVQMGYANGWVQ